MKKKRIISILGDANHDHDILLNEISGAITEKMENYELVDVQVGELNAALNNNPELVVLSKMNVLALPNGQTVNWLTGDIEDKLISYVEAGGGLVVWHSGMYGHPADGKFIQMVGGRFYHRPPDFLKVKYTTVANTPMTGDAKEIEIMDEHFLMACDMEKANVFLNSSSTGGETPAGWYRKFGKGKICCMATPHPLKSIQSPELNEIFYNCLKWCSEKE